MVGYGSLSGMLSRFATREVNKLLHMLPDVEASCGTIHVGLVSGTASVDDVRFSYRGEPAGPNAKAPGSEIYVERIEFGRLFYSLLLDKQMIVHSFNVIRPRVELWMDEEHPKLCFPDIQKDTSLHLDFPFKRAELLNLSVEEASLALHSIRTSLDVVADNCSLSAHNLAYADSTFTFNDSVYSFALASAAFRLPDGNTRIQTNHVAFQNKGKLTIGASRMTYCAGKKQEPGVAGSDIRIDRIEIGPVSHEMLFKRQILIQSVAVRHPRMELWMDEKNPELSFPQTTAKEKREPLTLPFERAEIKKLHILNAALAMHSTRTKLDVAADSCSFHMQRLVYDSRFHCDTVLNYAFGHASVRFPDGAMQLDTRGITRVDQDGLTIGATRLFTTKPNPGGSVPGSDIRVESVHIAPISIALLAQKEALLRSISINNPHAEIWLDEHDPELSFPSFKRKPKEKPFHFPLDLATIQHVKVNNASFAMHCVHNRLDVIANDVSAAVNDIMYAEDECFSYNDSVYQFSLRFAGVTMPDGLMRMEVNGIKHVNQGPLFIGKTHIGHVVKPKELGELLNEPVTWMNMDIDSVSTSPFNPFRKAKAKDWSLARIHAVVGNMDVFRDERFKPKRPSPMPQEGLMSIPAIFRIDRADAHVRHMNVDLSNTDINNGHLELNRLNATVTNITNRRGQTMYAKGNGPLGKGKANIAFSMTMNDEQSFTMDIRATQFNANMLNSFVRPLVGISFDVPIDTVETRYSGDRIKAAGTFKLLYHGLEVQAHKEDDVPYKIVTQNAKAITHIGNTLLPKSNPKKPGTAPREYNVQWKRDPWKLVELYLFGPCIDGAVKTFLPGLFLTHQVKQPKEAKTIKGAKETPKRD